MRLVAMPGRRQLGSELSTGWRPVAPAGIVARDPWFPCGSCGLGTDPVVGWSDHQIIEFSDKNGAAEKNRTSDPTLTKGVLYP